MTDFAPRLFAALAVAGGLLAAPAFAAPAETAPTATVRHADLDLTTAQGRQRLDRRVAAAAASVCPPLDPMRLETSLAANQCRRAAIAGARPMIETALAAAQGETRVAANAVAAAPAAMR